MPLPVWVGIGQQEPVCVTAQTGYATTSSGKLDLGTTLTQQLLEPRIHDGIEQNWVISAQWRY